MGGRVYSPYTGEYFSNTSVTEIDHIVARSEAHNSGLCAESLSVRRSFARDVLNLTLANPVVNRQKAAKDLAEWLPDVNQCWFEMKVVDVKRKYGLSMDLAEAQRAVEVLASCSDTSIAVCGRLRTDTDLASSLCMSLELLYRRGIRNPLF